MKIIEEKNNLNNGMKVELFTYFFLTIIKKYINIRIKFREEKKMKVLINKKRDNKCKFVPINI